MKTILLAAAAIIVTLSALTLSANEANEANEASSKEIETGKFYGLIVNANANVILTQGEEFSVQIEGDSHDIGKLHIEVVDGALVINGKEGSQAVVHVSADDINLIEANGNARVFVRGVLNSDILLLKANDHASIRADVRALKVGMIAHNNGKIVVTGNAGDAFIRVSNKGMINSTDLRAYNQTQERVVSFSGNKTTKKSTLKLLK